MNADGRCHRSLLTLLLMLGGCGGTLATVHVPPLPDPPPSRFESFDSWDQRVNTTQPATTRATTQLEQMSLCERRIAGGEARATAESNLRSDQRGRRCLRV
jgi:hypothetical protein